MNNRTSGSSCSLCKDALKHILIVCFFKRASLQWEYLMDNSIWMNACFFLFCPKVEWPPIPSISPPTATPYWWTPKTQECCLMPRLWHDLFQLFDMVRHSPLHIHWSIWHPCPPPTKLSKVFQFTFRILNVNFILVIIIFSPPHMFKPIKKIVQPN
jgi:hypothetical protein